MDRQMHTGAERRLWKNLSRRWRISLARQMRLHGRWLGRVADKLDPPVTLTPCGVPRGERSLAIHDRSLQTRVELVRARRPS